MGLFRLKAKMIGLAIGAMTMATTATAAGKTPGLSDRYCQEFVEEITQNTDEDLALYPYLVETLTGIHRTLNELKLTPEQLVKNIVDRDVRGLSFKIEGMGDALEAVDPEYFAQIHAKGQTLENLIGDYTFELELLEFVRKNPELSPHLNPKVEAMFIGRINGRFDSLVDNLRREGWTGEKLEAYRQVITLLEKSKPVTKKSYLKKKLLKWMADQFEDLHEKIVTKKIRADDIEGGIHKMRRAIRKIAIVILSFDGMFFLDDSLKIAKITLEESATKTKFVPNETNLLKRAVPISRDGFFYMGQLMGDFGRLKSGDGMKEYVYRAVKRANLGPDADGLLKAVDPKGVSKKSFEATRKEAADLFEHMVESKFLLQMAEYFRQAAREF